MISRLEEDNKVVAILTMSDSFRMFRGNRQNFQEIIKTGKDMGYLVYVLTTRDLIMDSPTVKGFVPSGDQTWEQKTFPFPRIIYNRIPNREDEMRPKVGRKIKACLQHPKIDIYNPYFFNKRQLFSWLDKSRHTRQWAPSTKRLKGLSSLHDMLKQTPYLYLKPEEGKAGRGIMRLKYQKNKNLPFRLQIQNNRSSTTYKAASLERLWRRVYQETRDESYLIQQGIELASLHGRPFDLRILVQKTEHGSWSVTGVGARMAGIHSITTHVPRGGSIEDPEKLLNALFGSEQSEEILSKVRSAAVQIARQIEKGSECQLGEMSMDLGVDDAGSLWFFEANARPMKFDEPMIRKRSLERIFKYCDHLIGRRS
ncbi:YheC/YheD family protein [Paenibacillus lemnae]|uniref:YheC/YheD family protein n=1 Tax=Paenibacillus lemnae TaxID=1330551 RepID=A0A848M5K7_PAELE|nr:YheC/YheD family protein [Paenibacillus lemnae]NMO95511.1 YheC/YheD family protein [Paenibacillus lemnae]